MLQISSEQAVEVRISFLLTIELPMRFAIKYHSVAVQKLLLDSKRKIEVVKSTKLKNELQREGTINRGYFGVKTAPWWLQR